MSNKSKGWSSTLYSAVLFFATLSVQLKAQPSATIYGAKEAERQEFSVYISFSDTIQGVTASDLQVTNGTVVEVISQGKYEGVYYSPLIRATNPGEVTIQLPAGTVQAKNGGQNNTASNTFTMPVEYNPQRVYWKIDSNEEWQGAGHTKTGLTVADGEVVPSGNTGNYSSAMRTFTEKVKPEKVIFHQSAKWDNWSTEGSQSHPGNSLNAPIFLPVKDKDYYFFAYGSGGIYWAYHSTNMSSWTTLGPVHSNPNTGEPNNHWLQGRWMTSAEYKDGLFYVIGDVPNDEDPHLWIDSNFTDDNDTWYSDTAVFHDPSHGSDAAFIRTDEDDRFHIIYEDWTPIQANARSFDSPLGGHTSSEDGINGYIPHEHAPIVDHRTTPTGEIGTHGHPAWEDPLEYEIHSPEQPAYGDWGAIKIGPRTYLVADFDIHQGGTMTTAIMASNSIFKEFELVSTVGEGHPDPSVGFAEGKFWLFTQPGAFSSPGPWVESVEARAGVDTDGNGTIDEWTEWQTITENYDHKEGYARVVEVEHAEVDMSSLPEGLGFKFEYRVSDEVNGEAAPIMDFVEMSFIDELTSVFRASSNSSTRAVFDPKSNRFQYEVAQLGTAVFKLFNIKGELVREIRQKHSQLGTFSVDLGVQPSTWHVVEYQLPGIPAQKLNK